MGRASYWLVLLVCIARSAQGKHFLVETEDEGNAERDYEGGTEDSTLTEDEAIKIVLEAGIPKVYIDMFNEQSESKKKEILQEVSKHKGDEKTMREIVEEKVPFECRKCTHNCDCKGNDNCFSGSSTVKTRRGNLPIGNLQLGDDVLTFTSEKGAHYTEFLGWLDRNASAVGDFLKISTNSSSIVLTGNHLIFRSAGSSLESVFADQIEEGDRLVSWKGSRMREEAVVAVEPAREKGIWTPLTMEGTLLVDGILASSYASFSHAGSDLALAPVKMFPTLLLDNEQSQHKDGCREVVKLMKNVATAVGLRQRNQGQKEHPTSCCLSQKAKLAAVGFSKQAEL